MSRIRSGIFRGKLQQIKTDRHTLRFVIDPLLKHLTSSYLIMKPSVVIALIFLMSCCLPATSTPNFNLASRQKLKRHHELHKHFVSSSATRSTRHHKKRHAISRRDAEVISSSANNDQSQNICSTDKQREIWQSIVYCQPNPTLVELQKPPSSEVSTNDNIVHMMPGNICLSIHSKSEFLKG
jgi:hypothetical protein